MNFTGRILLALVVAMTSLSAMSVKRSDPSAGDDEIRIGNLMPYTGRLAEFAPIGKAEAAYFEMINERGGVNGRKVRFISQDDNSDPTVALDLTRGLVERQDVLLMFGSFGTPGNLAVRGFLNERKIPQLFVASGDEALTAWRRDNALFPLQIGVHQLKARHAGVPQPDCRSTHGQAHDCSHRRRWHWTGGHGGSAARH